MRGLSKKMLISILTSVIVFVTMVATTFAWVGIFTYANSDLFQMNLKVVDQKTNYFLTISSSGKKGTFSDSIPISEIERQVVNNRFNNMYSNESDDIIHKIYNLSPLSNVSVLLNESGNLGDFYSLNVGNKFSVEFVESNNNYLTFDIYLSVDTKEGISPDTTGIKANVILNEIEKCLDGTQMYYRFLNDNPFTELPSDSVYSILKEIDNKKNFNINSKNAVRFSLSLYNPISIDEAYNDFDLPIKTVIYQGGNQLPTYNETDNVYDLGGILESEYNTASKELLTVRSRYIEENSYFKKLSETVNNRNDLELIESNREIWDRDAQNEYLGCMNGIQTKMKIKVCLWFEGWDSDCIKAIEEKPITLNLSFTANKDY